MNNSEEDVCQLIVSGSEGAVDFELSEHALDPVTFSVVCRTGELAPQATKSASMRAAFPLGAETWARTVGFMVNRFSIGIGERQKNLKDVTYSRSCGPIIHWIVMAMAVFGLCYGLFSDIAGATLLLEKTALTVSREYVHAA